MGKVQVLLLPTKESRSRGLNMNMTERALHEYLETKIDNFKDADLYNDPTIFQVDDDVIESQIEQGFLSINNRQGREAYYCDIENEYGFK